MTYWLMKSEPDELSIEALARQGQARWDGVRNYQARNYLRQMRPDDLFFFYHSSCPQPGIAGVGRIVSDAYPDPTALDAQSPYFDSRARLDANPWSAVDVAHAETFPQVLPLARLRGLEELADLALVHKGSRLSVMPVTEAQWRAIRTLA